MADSTDPAAVAAYQAAVLQIVKNNILMPVMVGTFLSCLTCGVVLALTGTYFSRFPNDRPWMKFMVGALAISAIGDTASNSSWCFQNSSQFFGDVERAIAWKYQFTAYLWHTPVIIAATQAFFLWRCWIVSQKKATVLVALGAIATACGVVFEWYCAWWTGANAVLLSDFTKIAAYSWAFCAAQLVSDCIATATLTYYLVWVPRNDKSAATVASSPLVRILTQAFATNATSLFLQALVMGLIGYSINEGSLAYCIPGYLENKVYGLAVVVALNSRTSNYRGFDTTSPSHLHSSSRSKGFGSSSRPLQSQSVHVHVQKDVEVEHDTEMSGQRENNPYSAGGTHNVAFRTEEDGVSLEEKGVKGF